MKPFLIIVDTSKEGNDVLLSQDTLINMCDKFYEAGFEDGKVEANKPLYTYMTPCKTRPPIDDYQRNNLADICIK